MAAKIDAFLNEVRNMPSFVTAAALHPKWLEEFRAVERGLKTVDREADNNPAMLDALDEIQAVIVRSDLSVQKRLLEICEILTVLRTTLKLVSN